jgi:hypothetical protein
MKTVFSDNSQIAHLFAYLSQYEARNSANNFYFRNKSIFSYGSHFCIAKHIQNSKGEKALLFTKQSYSNTTSKHIAIVRQATSHLNKIYCISPEYSHGENFERWLNLVESEASNLLKAKKPEKYLLNISRLESEIVTYSKFFEIEIPEKLKEALSIKDKSNFLAYQDKKELFEKQEKERQQKERIAKHKKSLKDWLNGKTHILYNKVDFDYLRLNGDNVETSQGVKIPLNDAKAFYLGIKENRIIEGQHILGFSVLKIDKKSIQIGCHDFKIKYLLDFGAKLFN